MKNQFFGDQNDFIKYAILRVLVGSGLKATVCWMLTTGGDSPGGSRYDYLEDPDQWRSIDPPVFDALVGWLQAGDQDVSVMEQSGLLPECNFHEGKLGDDPDQRSQWFQALTQIWREFVFFDPDNGLEVRSVPYGRKGSSRYLYWDELAATYATGRSVLVYQTFRRQKRGDMIRQMAAAVSDRTGVDMVYPRSLHAARSE